MSHICKLYLPREENQEVDSMRWLHMFKSIEIWEDEENHIPNGNERRIYIEGLDFYENEAKYPLPYATLNGKKKTMENFYEEVLGEKLLDEDV